MSDKTKISDAAGEQLDDLVFEIVQGGEAKFLLGVCDDLRLARTLRLLLKNRLHDRGKQIVFVSARSLVSNFLEDLFAISKAGTIDAIVLWGLLTAPNSVVEPIFRNLNFHRDTIARLRTPLVLWLRSDQLTKLASNAPDFWSRRTAVYAFTRTSSRELLTKLFASSGRGSLTQTRLACALGQILTAERQLGRCLRRHSFSYDEPDEFLRRIHIGLAELHNECSEQKHIDIALWLWSSAHLDSDLQQSIEQLSTRERNVYEYVYTDRNEALLYTAQKMEDIISAYERSVDEAVGKRKAPSLIRTFRRVAMEKLNSIADELGSYIGASQKDFEAWFEDAEKRGDDRLASRIEDTFGAQASYELEGWLAGYNGERPPFFTPNEGKMLKILYSAQNPIEDLRHEFEMNPNSLKKEIRRLEEKVRMYLATAEKQQRPATGAKA